MAFPNFFLNHPAAFFGCCSVVETSRAHISFILILNLTHDSEVQASLMFCITYLISKNFKSPEMTKVTDTSIKWDINQILPAFESQL